MFRKSRIISYNKLLSQKKSFTMEYNLAILHSKNQNYFKFKLQVQNYSFFQFDNQLKST